MNSKKILTMFLCLAMLMTYSIVPISAADFDEPEITTENVHPESSTTIDFDVMIPTTFDHSEYNTMRVYLNGTSIYEEHVETSNAYYHFTSPVLTERLNTFEVRVGTYHGSVNSFTYGKSVTYEVNTVYTPEIKTTNTTKVNNADTLVFNVTNSTPLDIVKAEYTYNGNILPLPITLDEANHKTYEVPTLEDGDYKVDFEVKSSTAPPERPAVIYSETFVCDSSGTDIKDVKEYTVGYDDKWYFTSNSIKFKTTKPCNNVSYDLKNSSNTSLISNTNLPKDASDEYEIDISTLTTGDFHLDLVLTDEFNVDTNQTIDFSIDKIAPNFELLNQSNTPTTIAKKYFNDSNNLYFTMKSNDISYYTINIIKDDDTFNPYQLTGILNEDAPNEELKIDAAFMDTVAEFFTADNKTGDYKLTILATDAARNPVEFKTIDGLHECSNVLNFAISNISPEITVTNLADGGYYSSLPDFQVGLEEDTRLTITFDDAPVYTYDDINLVNTNDFSLRFHSDISGLIVHNINELDNFKAEGNHTLEIKSTNYKTFNNTTTKTINFTIDNTNPVLELLAYDEDNAIVNNNDLLNQSVRVEIKAIDVNLDDIGTLNFTTVTRNGQNQVITNFGENTFTEDGIYIVTTKAVDLVGFQSEEKSFTFTIDKEAPTFSVDTPQGSFNSKTYYNALPVVTINTTEVSPTYSYKIMDLLNDVVATDKDGNPLTGTTNTINVPTGIVDGQYNLNVTVSDGATNKTEYNSMFIIDTVSPVINFTNVPTNPEIDGNLDIGITIDEAYKKSATVEVYKDGTLESTRPYEVAELNVVNSPMDIENVVLSEEGVYQIKVTTIDQSGKSANKNLSLTIDKTAPEITTAGLTNGDCLNVVPNLNISVTDTTATTISVQLLKNNVAYNSYNSSTKVLSVPKLILDPDGTYKYIITAIDNLGHTSTETITVIKDASVPSLVIKGVIDKAFYNKNVPLNIAAIDNNFKALVVTGTKDHNGSVSELNLNSAVSNVYNETFKNEGIYNLEIRALDKAYNETIKNISFTIDKTDPVVTVTGPANNSTVNNPKTVNITSSEPGNLFINVTRDGTNVYSKSNLKTQNTTFSNFSKDGVYVITVYSIDRATNKSAVKTLKVTKDSTAPVISISGPKDGSYNSKAQTVTISSNELNYDSNTVNVIITRMLGGKTVNVPFGFKSTGKSTSHSFSANTNGLYKITVTSKDTAGNVATSKSSSFTIDTVAPKIEITVPTKPVNYDDLMSLLASIKDDYLASKSVILTKADGTDCSAFAHKNSFDELLGGTCIYSSFDKTKENDGTYTLKVSATDKAGNATTVSKSFTVNRFGSIFSIKNEPSKYQKKLTDDIVITETNLTKITKHKIEITKDGKLQDLNDFSLTDNKKDNKFEKTYTLNKSNFTSDGVYTINIITTDEAGNISESKEYIGEVWFAIDNSKPAISVTDLNNGELYKVVSKNVYLNISDTISNATIIVTIDGEQVDIRKDKDGKEYFTIGKGINQTIVITATDEAGNKNTVEFDNITVSTSPLAKILSNKLLLFGIGGGFAGFLLLLLLLLKKRKSKSVENNFSPTSLEGKDV